MLAALSAMANAQASEFDGPFVGVRIGGSRSDNNAPPNPGGKDATVYGLDGGYNWDIQHFLVGIDVFEYSSSTVDNYSSDAYGVDLKLGLPKGNWLPYARIGYAHTSSSGSTPEISGDDVHGGVGLEFKFAPSWGVNAEVTGSSAKSNGYKLNNENVSVGLRYYFGAKNTAPAPVVAKPEPIAEPAPAPIPVAEPAPAPAPQPRDNWKTILTEKPVILEGAHFATNSAKLFKTADVKLNEVVNAAKTYSEVKLEVSGHTDSTGKKAFNQKLSERRAASVKAWLVKHGVAADRIKTVGYADSKPIANNKTKSGRAANRRVEVRYVISEEKKIRVTE